MSIRDRLRSSSSILQPHNVSKDNAVNSDGIRVVTGVTLSCDDMYDKGEIHRDFRLIRGVHRTVDFVRASASNPSGNISVAAGGAAKATFSSPVMSRRHARITFTGDGSVTVMDIGSMHGTYVNVIDSGGFLPEMLKPRRHYELRSGDTLLLGKNINRDGKDWKPVAIRVTLTYDTGVRFTTPPPNRYGLFLNSADVSEPEEEDEDAYSVSSSDGEDDNHVGPSGSSPYNSPVISHVPLPLGVVGSAAASRESLASGSRSSDDLNAASGVFDLNRSISARNALRAILPPIPNIQSAIRRLPSLRELGIFSSLNGSTAESSEGNEGMNQDGEAPISASGVRFEAPDTTTLPPISVELPSTSQDVPPNAQPSQSAGAEDDTTPTSMFAWQEPSHPQNQLGLELNEQTAFYASHIDSQDNVVESQDFTGLQNSQDQQDNADHQEKQDEVKGADEEQQDDVRSMDISPSTSRQGTPAPDRFRATAVFDVDQPVADEESPRPAETEEQHCRCHEQEEQEEQQGHSQQTQAPGPMPVTPEKRRASYTLTPASAAELDTEHRRARLARFGIGFDAIPSPVSIGKERKKRVCARVGPTRRSPAPNPPGPFGRVKVATKHSPDVDVLRARVRSLESRMHEIQGSAIMMASVANASTSASAASVEEARKEMESMREEMRRLSGLMETLVAKMEARSKMNEPVPAEHAVDTPESEAASLASRKRKRSDDDTCTLGDMTAVKLSHGFADQVGHSTSAVSMEERIQSFHEPDEEPCVRPAKRSRTAEGKAVMTVAAAAGYTAFGAALAWATLAYVL